MTTRKRRKDRRGRAAVADVAGQLAALHEMTVGQLKDRYREVFGEPTRSGNKPYLKKKIAWRIQELAEGGLSDHAQKRIQELAPDAPVRWRASNGGSRKAPPAPALEEPQRDPALPPPGTVLTREHKGVDHQVTVLDDGFEFHGSRYKSLSKIALEITGTRWNGFLFFRLKQRTRRPRAGAGQ